MVTSMGPPDTLELNNIKKETSRLKKLKNKQDLMDQYLTTKKHEYEMSMIEREKDIQTIERDNQAKEAED